MPRTLAPTVVFRSKYSGLRLVRKNAEQVFNPSYNTVSITSPEVVYEFRSGVLEIPRNTDVLPDRYEDGEWKTQDALEWLRSHPEFNIRFIEVEEIAPDPSVILAAITDALIARDLEALHALGDEEYGTWARPEITEKLDAAYLSLQAQLEAAPKQKPVKE